MAYLLYGYAERDARELVCQFFAEGELAAAKEFTRGLPGWYHLVRLSDTHPWKSKWRWLYAQGRPLRKRARGIVGDRPAGSADDVRRAVIDAAVELAHAEGHNTHQCVPCSDPVDDVYDYECAMCAARVAVNAALPILRPDLATLERMPADPDAERYYDRYRQLHPEDLDDEPRTPLGDHQRVRFERLAKHAGHDLTVEVQGSTTWLSELAVLRCRTCEADDDAVLRVISGMYQRDLHLKA